MKLIDDFNSWWDLPKYKKQEIPAKKYADFEIVERGASNSGWPTDDKSVSYWVRLENNVFVGFKEVKNPLTKRRKKYCEFPLIEQFIKPIEHKILNKLLKKKPTKAKKKPVGRVKRNKASTVVGGKTKLKTAPKRSKKTTKVNKKVNKR